MHWTIFSEIWHSSNEVAGVYGDPYVRLFVRPSVRRSVGPSQSLILYSSKTAEQNFMKLSGIVHYMMSYCTSYFKFLSAWFRGFLKQNKDFAIQNMGKRGYRFVSIAHSISSYTWVRFWQIYPVLSNIAARRHFVEKTLSTETIVGFFLPWERTLSSKMAAASAFCWVISKNSFLLYQWLSTWNAQWN